MHRLNLLAISLAFGCYVPLALADEDVPLAPAMVRIPGKNYEIGKFEVTQGEWQAVMGSNPSNFTSCGDNCPVEQVSWQDIQIFLQKLNAKTGKQYRLPTVAEWEYACSGGSQNEYCGGNNLNALAWTEGNSNKQTHPVGQKKANGYGLHDMSGNVWEWMDDCWEGECAEHARCGGSWVSSPQFVRAPYCGRFGSAIRDDDVGFRLARTLP
ncbi:MAG: formylglycine-generating enzyme family protein [Gallionella sp.]|nr:formylglycine-generating enzyme family protein [Gallionella sp.]